MRAPVLPAEPAPTTAKLRGDSMFLTAKARLPQTTSWKEATLLCLLYAATFTVLASVLRQQHGFPLDDSYIHQTVARNLVRWGTLGFTPGHRSSGTTSLLWTWIQAAKYEFLPKVDPVWYNLALSYLFLFPIGPCLLMLTRLDRLPEKVCWAMAVLPALCGNLLWLGMIGMEHVLFISLTLLALVAWLPQSEFPGLGSAAWAGVFAGLLVLCRPEAVLFGPVLVLGPALVSRTNRTLAQYLTAACLWLVGCAVMLVTNVRTSGTLLPATLKGREWLYFHQIGGARTLSAKAHFIGAWVQRVPRVFSPAFTRQLNSLHESLSGPGILGEVLAAVCVLGAIWLFAQRSPRMQLLLLLAGLHFLTYFIVFPASGHGGRYQPLCLLLLGPTLCFGIYWILQLLTPGKQMLAFQTAIVFVSVALLFSLTTWRKVTHVGIEHINNTHGRVAEWMNQHLAPDTRFAAFDIGRISYDWPGHVIDLGGLVDPAYAHYLNEKHVPEYLQLQHVQYVLLPGTGISELGFREDMQQKEVLRYCSSYADWLLGFRYTIHATQCQVLYKL